MKKTNSFLANGKVTFYPLIKMTLQETIKLVDIFFDPSRSVIHVLQWRYYNE